MHTIEKTITCRECGCDFKQITHTHLRKVHNITSEKYQKKYPNADMRISELLQNRVDFKCENCGDYIELTKSEAKNRKYCSKKCAYEANSKNLEKKCKRCNKLFSFKPFEDREYCSKECSSLSNLPEQGESFEKECSYCGDKFTTVPSQDKKYCCEECFLEDIKRGNRCCKFCGEKFKIKWDNQKFCSIECSGKQMTEEGFEEVECDNCGEIFEAEKAKNRRFCGNECYIEFRQDNLVVDVSGSNNSQWVQEESPIKYGKFWNSAREKVLERDDYSCVVCGKGREEIGRNPDVHHIKPRRAFDDLSNSNRVDNLVCLCPNHHKMVEGWGLAPANVLD